MIAYLDNNSTTQCAPEVITAMLPFLSGRHGNPASPHVLGREAARAVAQAREQIAECIDCEASQIYFTSCATEANNLAILGAARKAVGRGKIVTSAIEHLSVLGPCSFLEEQGYKVTILPVSQGGVVDVDAAREQIDEQTLLVSVQGANNEIGTIQPVRALAELSHQCGSLYHCDAAQLLGKLRVSTVELGADLLTFSSHKAYGPKGIGFLVVRGSTGIQSLSPIQFGGGQENGVRPGTLNVPGIVGTGEACRLCCDLVDSDMQRIGELRAILETGIRTLAPDAVVLGAHVPRLPGTSNVLFPGIPSDLLVARTPSVCMSIGSACTSGTLAPSHVLLALGLSAESARFAVRLSLGRYNTRDEIKSALDAMADSVQSLEKV